MTHITESEMKQKYLDLLSQKFDSAEKLATEIINLESILELPKGTEHFVSDLRRIRIFPTCFKKRIWKCAC